MPVCLFCWLRSPRDFRGAVGDVIALGGDTDTAGAIVGALVGATAGAAAIPQEWLDGLTEFPRSVRWMRKLAISLAAAPDPTSATKHSPPRLFWPALLPRNLIFLLVVLAHGLRRLLPPY